jgi:hypothetical protein
MSLKQWHKHDPIEDEEFSLAASRISVRSPGSPDSTFIQDSTQDLESRTPAKRQGGTAGGETSDTSLDPAMWQMWQEMEGDEDGSGEIAMLCGDLDHDKACIDSRREFHSDPAEGWVMLKSSDLPAWAGAAPAQAISAPARTPAIAMPLCNYICANHRTASGRIRHRCRWRRRRRR